MDDATDGHDAAGSTPDDRTGPDVGDARAVAADAIAGLHPVVAQSRDGLTLVLLGRGRHAPRDRSRVAAEAVFALPSGAVGVAVGVFDPIVRLDAFDDPEALGAAWPGIVAEATEAWRARVRAIDAGIAPPPGRRAPDEGATARLIRRASIALAESGDAAGAQPGDVDVPIEGARVQGTARVSGGRAVHVALLPRDAPDAPDDLVP
jgi:hypothetical protein